MTLFVTSRPTERSFVWRKYVQHPSRREWIHGRLHDALCRCRNCKPPLIGRS